MEQKVMSVPRFHNDNSHGVYKIENLHLKAIRQYDL